MYSLFFSVPAYYSNGFFVFFCFLFIFLFFMLCLFADNVFQCCLMITFFFHHGRSRLRFLPWDLPVNLYPCTFPCSRLMMTTRKVEDARDCEQTEYKSEGKEKSQSNRVGRAKNGKFAAAASAWFRHGKKEV